MLNMVSKSMRLKKLVMYIISYCKTVESHLKPSLPKILAAQLATQPSLSHPSVLLGSEYALAGLDEFIVALGVQSHLLHQVVQVAFGGIVR